jgi:hydrogenase-4 component E
MQDPTLSSAFESLFVACVLLSEFGMLRLLLIDGLVRVYAIQSFFVAAFAFLLGWTTGSAGLFVLAVLTLCSKAVVIPLVVSRIVQRLGVEDRIPATVPVPMSFLVGAILTAIGFEAAHELHVTGVTSNGLAIGIAMLLIGFFLMITRANAVAQLIGFLTLENAVFVASLALAAQLPLIVAVLLLLDVLLPAAAFVVVIRVVASRHQSIHTVELTELRG